MRSRSTSGASDFYPPRLNPGFVRVCQCAVPLVGHWQYRMQLEVSDEELQRFSTLKTERVLLLPNHPTFHDWIAIFMLSAKLGEAFHYLAAYERFQEWNGWLLQRLGAYSIRRGMGDRPSVSKTLELLMQPACRLVIFPEGGCSLQNDTVMPFRAGAIQIALQAMNKLVKQGQAIPDFYVVPVSIKYRYTGDMAPVIHNTLRRLERSLRQAPASGSSFYERLRAVADEVLARFEQTYLPLVHDHGQQDAILKERIEQDRSWNDRILSIKTQVLQWCEQTLQISPASWEPIRERVYRIQYELEAKADHAEIDFQTYDTIHRAAARLLNFDAIYDGYVAANPTPERFLDTLIRLERAVFEIDQPLPKGHRCVFINLAEPINLKAYFESYQRDRAGTVEALTSHMRQVVQANLDRLSGEQPPSVPEQLR